MRLFAYGLVLAGQTLAQGDLAALLQSQPDLSTLIDLAGLVPGLFDTLSQSSNITILAPTNQAFENIPQDIPERTAVETRNVTALFALFSNHVVQGYYPSDTITTVPAYVQTQLNNTLETDNQEFTGFRNNYIGVVRNEQDVNILSGEFTVSNVVQADIRLGDGIIIHVVDTVLLFGPPFFSYLRRSGLDAMNGALVASDVDIALGLTGADEPRRNASDLTIFVPSNAAFEDIGSVLNSADRSTLTEILNYHILDNNAVFSPSITNTTVETLQGGDLELSVTPSGEIFVNQARIIVANVIFSNGVAHVIDSVLNPSEPFERSGLDSIASLPASERTAFPSATAETQLPFSSISFVEETSTYSTPGIFSTIAAIATPTASGDESATTSEGASGTDIATGAAPRNAIRAEAGAGMAVLLVALAI